MIRILRYEGQPVETLLNRASALVFVGLAARLVLQKQV